MRRRPGSRPRALARAAALAGAALLAAPAGAPASPGGGSVGIGPPGGEVRSLALAPGEPGRLYAGAVGGHLFCTRDGGERWEECGPPLPHDAVIDSLAVDPREPEVAWAAYWRPDGSGGLLGTTDGGRSWHASAPPGTPSLRALALAPSEPRVVYAGGLGGIWRSDDGGASWADVSGRAPRCAMVESLAVDPRDPLRVYAGTWRQAYASGDGGGSWRRLGAGMPVDRDVFSIALLPHDPASLFAGTCGYLYESQRGGPWIERRKGIGGGHRRIHAVLPHPLEPGRLLAGSRGGLYRSGDGGRSWSGALADVSVTALATDPLGTRFYVATEERGVLAGDEGSGFQERNRGIALSRVAALDADPLLQVAVAARTERPGVQSIHATGDGGETWSLLGGGARFAGVGIVRLLASAPLAALVVTADGALQRVEAGGVEIEPSPPGLVRALELAGPRREVVLAATDAGLFARATAGGDAACGEAPAAGPWRPLAAFALEALAVADDRFLAAGPGAVADEGVVVRGRARDGSVSVEPGRPAHGLPRRVVGLALDPAEPALAWAIGESDVARSEDGGRTWLKIALPWPVGRLTAVAADPAVPGQVLVLAEGGAIYRGHARGRHWLLLDADPGLPHARDLRLGAAAPGLALVATDGHGLRLVRHSEGPRPGIARQPGG